MVTPTYRAQPVSDVRSELAESPLWDRDIGLRWLDVTGRRLHTLDRDGHMSSQPLNAVVTCVERGPGRRLLAVVRDGFAWLDPDGGTCELIVTVLDDDTVTMNDGGIDPAGRCWAGSAARDGSWRGQLFCLAGGEVSARLANLGMSNGLDWSPSADVLYHADSTAGTVTAWRYDLDQGGIAEPHVLRSVDPATGMPDGLTVDAAGKVWLAVWGAGEVWQLDPETGTTTAVVDVPTRYPTSCVFGGARLTTLYITSAHHEDAAGGGLLYAAELPVQGRPAPRFAGDAS